MTNYNTDKNISPKKKTQDSSEKQKSKNVASALTWSIRRAISKQSYFSCNSIYNNNSLYIEDSSVEDTYPEDLEVEDPSVEDTYPEDLEVEDKYEVDLSRFLEKRKIRHNTEIEFDKWDKNKAPQQKCQLFHLTMHLNVLKDGNVDFVFPFSVWPLRSNKTLYNASDKELAARFNKSLNDALKLLKITPEYYYVITGEENLCDNNNRRHIHGCLRLPARFYDNKKSSATKCIYDILKRACGLTERQERLMSRKDKRTKEYKFAIASLNKQKPYGHMLDIGEPLKPDWAQERWSQYIISERNSPNNIHRTKKLSVDTVAVNDSLHAEYEKIISSEDWTHNTPSFKLITDRWAKVMHDYIKPTASKDETTVDLRRKAFREAKLKQLRDKVESTFFKKTKPSDTEKPKTHTSEEIDALLSEI